MKRSNALRFVALLVISVASMAFVGCYTPMGRPDYTASGALAGAATGAVIGSMGHRSGPGALVGGAVGALVGGIIGHGLDQAQEAQLRAQAPQTLQRVEAGQPLTAADVQALVQAGISDDLIISQIRNSRTVYHLTTADIIALRNSGVSNRVIDYMINTPSQVPSSQVAGVIGASPPPAPPETIVVAPGPDYYWVPGAWLWFGGRWMWNGGYWHRPRYYHHRPHRYYGPRHW
ncbi:17 kDa surface antigen [Desulfosarcina cetonica]|nr:17 kDa surface antigen [Desulfosarcina cetonica]